MCVKKAPHGGASGAVKVRKARPIMPDGRRSAARRYAALVAGYESEIGGDLSPAERGLVETAAMLKLRSEQLTADIIAGNPVDNGEIIRLAGASRRALSKIVTEAKPVSTMTFAEYAAQKVAAALESDNDEDDDGEG
jgi:hypothetical protein